MKFFFLFLLISWFCLSCGNHYPLEIKEALQQAGKNRHELEKVLEHYSSNPADSLKHKAAEFLIANMPGKYSEYYDAPWNDVATVCLRWTSSSDIQSVLDAYKLGALVKREDVKYITADYLISNIELAFQAWQDKPWGKYISFEIFCEEILPYRVSTEFLESWREKVLASFADINKTLREDSTMTAVRACAEVNRLLPQFKMDKDFPAMSYTQLMATTRSLCSGQVALAAFVMRTLGIPVTLDFTPHWAKRPHGHDWNSVCDSSGRHISFMGTETNPYAPHQGTNMLKSKVYRRTFARNRIINNPNEKDIPPLFRDDIKDISAEHKECIDVKIPVIYPPKAPSSDAYLALLSDFQWHIVGYGNTDSVNINFPAVGENVIYLPVYYTDGKQYSAGYPFLFDNNGRTAAFISDSPDSLLTFSAIAPPANDHLYSLHMIDGVFEGANKPDFSDAKIIHTVKKTPDLYNNVRLSGKHSYRYVRYKSPKDGYCNVAEIEFLGISGKKLEGVHIGTAWSYRNLGQTGDKAFDGDITTFYNAFTASGAWTGLDLGEQQTITAIRYVPLTDGHGIYIGHEYELLCWDKDSWKSLGKQTAAGTTVEFQAPSTALFYIVNLTAQKKGRVCYILDKQMRFFW
ncbi:MAG: discoidin domain-containing protein [Prevotellaceae bacterium]|jgi:hypothetical protein|nr:discoidin domain-containing protein [Prevotellaceae bacterium]